MQGNKENKYLKSKQTDRGGARQQKADLKDSCSLTKSASQQVNRGANEPTGVKWITDCHVVIRQAVIIADTYMRQTPLPLFIRRIGRLSRHPQGQSARLLLVCSTGRQSIKETPWEALGVQEEVQPTSLETEGGCGWRKRKTATEREDGRWSDTEGAWELYGWRQKRGRNWVSGRWNGKRRRNKRKKSRQQTEWRSVQAIKEECGSTRLSNHHYY